MKTLLMTAALALLAASAGSAESPSMTCRRANGMGCDARRVKTLESAVKTASSRRPALASVKALSLAASDGTLTCTQTSGKACTPEQLREIQKVSAALDFRITLAGN